MPHGGTTGNGRRIDDHADVSGSGPIPDGAITSATWTIAAVYRLRPLWSTIGRTGGSLPSGPSSPPWMRSWYSNPVWVSMRTAMCESTVDWNFSVTST